jgi:hypothetical protein
VPAQSLPAEAFVLVKRPPTDAFQGLTLFSPEHGALRAQQRISQKSAATSPALDLFDEAAFVLESSNQGSTWFVKETRLLTRHAAIGRSYETLVLASSLAALIARNPVHEESRAAVGTLLREAFAAFDTGVRSDIVYLKSLYRFARDEGYPVKQQWFPTLPPEDRTEVAVLLNRPLAGQTAGPETVARLRRRLEDYLRGDTDILIE